MTRYELMIDVLTSRHDTPDASNSPSYEFM